MSDEKTINQLRAGRAVPLPAPAYTIGGAIEQEVHTMIERDREHAIRLGEQEISLAEQLKKIREERSIAVRQGYAKAQFNSEETLKP